MTNNQKFNTDSIEQQLTEYKELNEALLDFLKGFQFDYRGQTTTIMGFAKLLLTEEYGTLNEEQTKFIERIYNSTRRLTQVTNEMNSLVHLLWSQNNRPEEVNLKQFFGQFHDLQIEHTGFGDIPSIWINRFWFHSTLELLFSMPVHDSILKRNVSFKSLDESLLIIDIENLLNYEVAFQENNAQFACIKVSIEQQSGFINWKQVTANKLEFELGLPVYSQ